MQTTGVLRLCEMGSLFDASSRAMRLCGIDSHLTWCVPGRIGLIILLKVAGCAAAAAAAAGWLPHTPSAVHPLLCDSQS